MKLLSLRWTVPLALITFVFGLFLWNYQVEVTRVRHRVQTTVAGELKRDMTRLRGTVEAAARRGDLAWARAEIAGLGADPHIEHALLIGQGGAVLASTRLRDIGKAALEVFSSADPGGRLGLREQLQKTFGDEVHLHAPVGGSVLLAFYPVELAGGGADGAQIEQGLLFLRHELVSDTLSMLDTARQHTVRHLLTLLLTTFILGLFLHFRLTRRIHRLIGVADQFAAGDFLAPTGVRGGDEIGELATSLASMGRERSRIESELADHRGNLQQLVDKQTGQLQEANEQLRQVLQTAHDPFVAIDEQGAVTEWNVRARDVLGWKRQDILGQPMADVIIPARFREQHKKGVERFLKTGKDEVFNKRLDVSVLHRDGRELTMETVIWPVRTGAGYMFNAFLRDVTDFRQVQERLRKLSTAIEHTEDRVMITDKNGVIEYVNPGFEKVTGYSKEDALGRTPALLRSGKHGKAFYEGLWQTILAGKVFKADFINKKKNGDLYYESQCIVPIEDEKGVLSHYVATGRDVTDLKVAEEKLTKALSVKTKFTSMVSHELRTPLAAVREALSIMAEGVAGKTTAKQKDLLGAAMRSTSRLARLINDVLDFQKIESGKMVLRPEQNDICTVLREVCTLMRLPAQKKGLELAVDVQEGIPKIPFDRDAVIQVFTNLVGNAIKFTPQGGITVSVRRGNNVVHVEVSDTGPGIRREDMERIFKSFEQIETVSPQEERGTGLGLAISKEIVELHRGQIWAESRYGVGSTFHVLLPVVERRGSDRFSN